MRLWLQKQFDPPKPSRWWPVLQVLLVASVLVAVGGFYWQTKGGTPWVWIIAGPMPVLMCSAWIWLQRHETGWLSGLYAACTLLGLKFVMMSQVMANMDPYMGVQILGWVLLLLSTFAFTLAFWAPSVPMSRIADLNVDTSREAPPAVSAGVPFHVWRLAIALPLFGACFALWYETLRSHVVNTNLIPAGLCAVANGFMLWRACARIGYRVPTPGAKLQDIMRRAATKGLQQWEHIDQQYMAFGGAVLMMLSFCTAGYQEWHSSMQVSWSTQWMSLVTSIIQWAASLLIAMSVPVVDAVVPSLKDPGLWPHAYDGRPMRVLMFLPDRDFDVTEVAVPWFMLRRRGHDVEFATEHGDQPQADPLLLTGVLCGKLGADPLPKQMYFAMEADPNFMKPKAWSQVIMDSYDGLILPGGHAPGMRQYLGSDVVREKVLEFWRLNRPVGAICHGPLVLARIKDENGHPILSGLSVTALPKYMEYTAFGLTCLCRGRYYRTYPETVEEEVTEAVGRRGKFMRGPITFTRGTPWDKSHACVVETGKLITARWPGDAYMFTRRFIAKLEEVVQLY